MKAAGKNRHGHRDGTMILVCYRHGLRASELVSLGRREGRDGWGCSALMFALAGGGAVARSNRAAMTINLSTAQDAHIRLYSAFRVALPHQEGPGRPIESYGQI
jgi:hypothetical protein